VCKIQSIKIEKATEKGEASRASPRMRKGMKMTASWVSSVGTITPPQIRQEHKSFSGRTIVSTRCKRLDLETTDMWLPANGSWVLESIDEIIGTTTLCLFLLGALTISPAKWVDSRAQETEKRQRKKARIRVQNSRRYVSRNMGWLDKLGAKVPDHNSEK
jgi:hypothetical protein